MNRSSQERRQFIGIAAHAAVTTLAQSIHPDRPTDEQLRAAVNPNFAGWPIGSVGGARADCASCAALWLSYCWPPADWRLLAVETDLADGDARPDLVWATASGGVIFDELKTGGIDRTAIAQARRQQTTGYARYLGFVGVRLFSATDPHTSVFVSHEGESAPLSESSYWFEVNP